MRALMMTKKVGGGWHPGANTVAYYELNGDADDYFGNYNLTANGTVTYETLTSGIQVAKTNNSQLQVNNFPSFAKDITVSIRVKQYENTTGYNNMGYWVKGANSENWDGDGISLLNHSGPSQSSGVNLKFANWSGYVAVPNFTDTGWHHWVGTYTHSTLTASLYEDGTLIGTVGTVIAPSDTTGWFALGVKGYGGKSKCMLSKCIVENAVWSAQEIADYYDLTKGDYGIS